MPHIFLDCGIGLRAMEERGLDGHRSEFPFLDHQIVDPDPEPICRDLSDPQRQTLCGAPALRSWFGERSFFTGTEPVTSQLTAQPNIAAQGERYEMG